MSRAFDDFERVDRVLRRALEAPSECREELVGRLCEGDDELRRRVLALLSHPSTEALLEAGGGFDPQLFKELQAEAHEAPGTDPVETEGEVLAQPSWQGQRLGPYLVGEEIGRGGMAVVYRGERSDGAYQQSVAIKVLDGWRVPRRLAQRFVQERQILAQLEHPHIARLLDGGESKSGLPYLVMEFVNGVPIDEYCDERRLTVDERLELLLQVAGAVQYAHRNLIVHRDLKPSNILVTARGQPKLLDFGIAKLLAESPGEVATQTAAWNRLLTPQYASPEQLLGEPVSTATDVYALGLLLFELLTGVKARGASASTPAEMLRNAQTEDLTLPSRALGQARGGAEASAELSAQCRSTTPSKLRQRLLGDLDTITGKALQREPQRRYGSAQEFSDDLRRHLAGLPVAARGDSWSYRLGKLARRRAGLLVAAALLLTSLLAGLWSTSRQAERATRAARKAESVTAFLVDLLRDSDPEISQGREVTVREVLERASRTTESLEEEPELQATLEHLVGQIYGQLAEYERGVEHLRKAIALRSAGPHDAGLADSLDLLAQQLAALGELDQARTTAHRALELRRAVGDSNQQAASLGTLAKVELERGDHAAARAWIDEALATVGAAERAEAEQQARLLNLAAQVYRTASSFEQAEAFARRGAELGRTGQLSTFESIDALHSLAGILMLRGQEEHLADAERAMDEAIAKAVLLLGENHARVAQLQADLASVRARRGDPDGGERAYRRALSAVRSHLGDEHPATATMLNNAAVFYHRLGRWHDAMIHYEQSLTLRERILEPNHPLIGTTRAYLGLAQHRAGDPRAEATYRRALDELTRSRGEEHEKVGNLRADLGVLLAQQGRYAEAEPQLRKAIEILRPIFGDADSRVDDPSAALGHCLCARGAVPDGKALLAASRSWRLKRWAAEDPKVMQLDVMDAFCDFAGGQHEEARQRVAAVLADFEGRLREGHVLTGWAERVLKKMGS